MPEEAVKKDEELQDENEEVVVEVDEEESSPEQEAAGDKPSEDKPAGDELEQYSDGVKKRISKLTAKMREAERREKAAVEYAQSVQTQLEQSNKRTQGLDNSFVQEFENRVTLQDQLLRQQLKDAIDRGDIDKQVEAQQQIAQLVSQSERLKYVKQQQAANLSREEQAATQQVSQQQVSQQQAAEQLKRTKPEVKAEEWAARNEWFGQDEPMTITAFSIHKKLVEEEGYDAQSDEYYEEIDRRIKTDFPHKFNGQARARSGPAVGAATRGRGAGGKKSIKLTPSQVAISRKLGITKEQYAKQLMRMNQS
mgnify:CR=1 FL=1|tara:strand:- start:2176 stop:3102 length:927 start_codon:yes stop_codon:yes gene_type:complete